MATEQDSYNVEIHCKEGHAILDLPPLSLDDAISRAKTLIAAAEQEQSQLTNLSYVASERSTQKIVYRTNVYNAKQLEKAMREELHG